MWVLLINSPKILLMIWYLTPQGWTISSNLFTLFNAVQVSVAIRYCQHDPGFDELGTFDELGRLNSSPIFLNFLLSQTSPGWSNLTTPTEGSHFPLNYSSVMSLDSPSTNNTKLLDLKVKVFSLKWQLFISLLNALPLTLRCQQAICNFILLTHLFILILLPQTIPLSLSLPAYCGSGYHCTGDDSMICYYFISIFTLTTFSPVTGCGWGLLGAVCNVL